MRGRLVPLLLLAAVTRAQPPAKPVGVVSIDLTQAADAAARPLPQFSGRSPQGLEVGATERYLTLAGRPWLPVVAELTPARLPATEWTVELPKLKAAKIGMVLAPVPWIYHEEARGRFSWEGSRDIAAFVRQCAAFGLPCILRLSAGLEPGVRAGGIPDWAKGPAEEAAFCQALAAQLKGLLWQDGGPVIGLQIDALDPAAAIALKRTAQAAGLAVPYYFSTAAGPDFLPLGQMAPDGNGFNSQSDPLPDGDRAYQFNARMPFAAVLATGQQASYRRRAQLVADDVGAEALVALGSGVNLPIYGLFHGGMNPMGAAGPLNETRLHGSPADLPRFGYDAQAPIGATGALRPAYHTLRALDLFTSDFGAMLAPLQTHLPEKVPAGADDSQTIRWTVRTNGAVGFLFINNFRRTLPLPARRAVQFELRYPGYTQLVPVAPVTLPSQTYAVWPVNLWLGGIRLIYAAAQPLCRIGSWYVFAETAGVSADFLFDKATLAPDSSAHLGNLTAGLDSTFTITGANGVAAHILLLKHDQAGLAWKLSLDGREHLILADEVTPSDNGLRVVLRSRSTPVLVFPQTALNRPSSVQGIFTHCELPGAPPVPAVREEDTNPLQRRAPSLDAHGVVIPPTESDYAQGQQVKVRLPLAMLDPGARPFLRVNYTGDAARAFIDGQLVADSFNDGGEWVIPVNPFVPGIIDHGLTLQIVPFHPASPIYLTPAMAPWFGSEYEFFPSRVRVTAEAGHSFELRPAASDK